MSGVAKDDTNPNSPSDETAAAKDAADAESNETNWTADEPRSRRGAPHLRVVGETEEFVPPAVVDASHQRIGAVMKATRENLGLSLEQVSKETRVHLSHLRAIEDMTPNLLGAPVYAKGYIRAYARHLGMDEMGTLERYLRECAILKDPEKQDIAPPATGRKLPTAVPVLGFLVLALAGAAGAYFVINNKQTEAAQPNAAAAVAAAPSVAAPAPSLLADGAADAASPTAGLHIIAVKPGHLEVRSADGTKIIDRDVIPGDRPAVPRVGFNWTVSTPDGSAFEWRLGDQSLGLLKADGGPVYSQSVDLAAQRPPVAPAPVAETAAPAPTEAPPSTAGAAPAPAATTPPATAAVAPPRPRTPAPRPPRQQPAPPAAAVSEPPPVTAAAPPPVQAPAAPPRDPALAAYPDQ
jgi:hypothetical protein